MLGFLFVALGGALGAVCRYAVSLIPVRTSFPVLTLLTNILGAVLIGFIAGAAGGGEDVSPNTVLFWKTGVCGGFTTFSTFSLEAYTLLENKSYLAGGVYIALSCACGLIELFTDFVELLGEFFLLCLDIVDIVALESFFKSVFLLGYSCLVSVIEFIGIFIEKLLNLIDELVSFISRIDILFTLLILVGEFLSFGNCLIDIFLAHI